MNESRCDIMRCDLMVRKYLPSVRAEMVCRLVNQKGMSQSDAAKKLGVSRAAVSQYLSKKRGVSGIELSDELNTLIDRWALAVIGEESQVTLCDICRCAMDSADSF